MDPNICRDSKFRLSAGTREEARVCMGYPRAFVWKTYCSQIYSGYRFKQTFDLHFSDGLAKGPLISYPLAAPRGPHQTYLQKQYLDPPAPTCPEYTGDTRLTTPSWQKE